MENDRTDSPGVSRREFLGRVAAGGAGLAVAGGLARPGAPAWAAKGSVTLADVGVGDPGGDWSKFSGPTGWDVKLVAMGNAPSGVLNVLIAGGGTQIYDIVNIVGGMQKPLVELRAVGQPAHQPRGLRDGLLGGDGVRGQEEGRERRVRGAEGGLPPLGHGGLYRPEPEALQGAGEGRLRAARLHARRLVRSEDHVEPRLHDEPGGRGLREEQPRGVRAGRVPGDRRDRRQRAEEVPVRRHLAEPLADARGDVRVGVGALQGRVACVARYALLVLPLTFVAGTLLVPLGLMFVWSFWERAGFWIRPAFTLASYAEFFAGVRLSVLERSLVVAAGVTLLGLLLAYPIAYFLALRVRRDLARNVLLLFTIPFLVNYIIRTFSWVYLLSRTGPVNRALMAAGVTQRAVDWLLFSDFAVFVGLISSYMPFMIYPLWAALDGLDRRLVEASWLLGASPRVTFLRVTLPLSMPGVFAAVIFGFVGTFGESAVPIILGGVGYQLMGTSPP